MGHNMKVSLTSLNFRSAWNKNSAEMRIYGHYKTEGSLIWPVAV